MFLLLLTSGPIPLKLVALLFIKVPLKVRTRVSLAKAFYIFIASYSLVYGALFLFNQNYWIAYFLVLLFWIIAFIAFCEIENFIKQNDFQTINATINCYFFINFIFVVQQLISIIIYSGSLNPFNASASHGDMIMGIYSNSSINMIVMGFYAIYFFYKRSLGKLFIALFCFLMTGYMSGLLILLVALTMFFFLFEKRISLKIYSILIIISIIVFYYFFSRENYDYALGYINRALAFDAKMPFKLKSYIQTYHYWTDSAANFIFGAGPGNFSSRVTFVVSGDYVGWYPESLSYVSKSFAKNHFWIWNYDFNNPWDNINNAANQPFSAYNQIIGEYGLIGLIAFIFLYIGFWMRGFMSLTYGKIIFISFLGYLVLDYWFEYFSVVILFELFMLLNRKESETAKL
ncbi:hypothetical protein SAMN04487941_0898 [Pontibacter akesuensis]|uniref:O-antigen ligase-related domain-containing protein n=1 Tax=Pontibacter akesuensis TaxID=388950 RepID=A0A1I7GBW2_9BACT|nr:hypothetical protein SAMN04487941_0898 [Pontibacter akesuensis]